MNRDIIIALDVPGRQETLNFLDRFPAGEKPFVKIGMELFYAEGPDIVREIKVGDVYLGKVTRLMQFGAFVELLPGKEGMVHISKLSNKRVEKIEDFCKVGDEMLVRVNEIDEKKRVNLIHRGVTMEDLVAFQSKED